MESDSTNEEDGDVADDDEGDTIDHGAMDKIVSIIQDQYTEGEAYYLVRRLIEEYQLVVNSDAILEPEDWIDD